MIFVIITVCLLVSFVKYYQSGEFPLALQIKNGLAASYLTLGHVGAIQAFWWLIRSPTDALNYFSTPNTLPRWVPIAIWIAYICLGILAVFSGFGLANHKLSAVKLAINLIPFLWVIQMLRFFLAAQKKGLTFSGGPLWAFVGIGVVFISVVNFSLLKFYSSSKNCSYFRIK